jgi:hypothetical protein
LPLTPHITGVRSLGHELQFQFEAQSGVSYAVEFRAVLAFGMWFVLTNLAPDSASRNVVVSDVHGASNRFYRVVAR